MIGQFSGILAADGINISDMTNKSKGEYAYTMIDIAENIDEDVKSELEGVDGVLKIRVIIK